MKHPKQDGRQELFRGVYEENMRITGRKGPRGLPESRSGPRARRGLRTIGVMTGVLVLFGALRIGKDMQGREPVTEMPRVVSAFEESFGNPGDPGLRRADNREVPLANLFGLSVKTIVIDPGHGGRQPGAVGATGLAEKTVTLDVARRLQRRLEDHGYRILLTREDDTARTLRERVRFADEAKADLFISIHLNALPVDSLSVVETFYYSPRGGSPAIERLAAIKNEDSGYSVGEWRQAMHRLGTAMKSQESRRLASTIQTVLYRNIQQLRSDVVDWGTRRGPFMVLLGVDVPAVLTEIAVISNRSDEARLYTSAYREHLAMSLETGIVTYLEGSLSPDSSTEQDVAHALEETSTRVR